MIEISKYLSITSKLCNINNTFTIQSKISSHCDFLLPTYLIMVTSESVFSPGFFFEKVFDDKNIMVECGIINYVHWYSF